MRKFRQKQILDFVQTLFEGTEEIKGLLSQGQTGAAVNLLADCQDSAVQIGTFVEQLEGEGTQTVALLEQYCEQLYKTSREISEGDTFGRGAKQLRKGLIKIENSIRSELKATRFEMLFLPYKASMWDSMESVWLAANADPACDAVVMPIPYYDRNPDGSMGLMHYEGKELPEEVPVTDYTSYDIEARHPDVIIIHNPYDDGNYVTSVHPDYYSVKIKAYTDLLVYIPYFVGRAVPEHFCVCAGTRHADRVYVQSEGARQDYIRQLGQYLPAATGGTLQERFVAAGSPKFDKVIQAKPEDFAIPEAWRALMAAPGGKRKKVILYNTTVAAALQGDAQYSEKLSQVLDFFRRCDDAVLWWRPHPLAAATFKSMRPHLYEAYIRMVDEYQRAGWGIYDDSADLHRAICLTDAYYGDWSSLVSLYGLTGKPILIQDVYAEQKPDMPWEATLAGFALDEGESGWGWDYSSNGLFRMDWERNTASLVARDDSLPGMLATPYWQVAVVGDKIIVLSFRAGRIFRYNKKTAAHQQWTLDPCYLSQGQSVVGYGITRSVTHGGKVYGFGVWSKAVVVFDAAQETIAYDTVLYEYLSSIPHEAGTEMRPIYVSEPDGNGDVNILFKGYSQLIRYGLVTKEVAVLASHAEVSSCTSAVYDKEHYWLLSRAGDALLRWNAARDHMARYTQFPAGFQAADAAIDQPQLEDCGEYLLIFPHAANMILRFDKKTEVLSPYTKMPLPSHRNYPYAKYQALVRTGSRLYAFAPFNKTVYELDVASGVVTPHTFVLENDSREDMAKGLFNFPDGYMPLDTGDITVMDSSLVGGLSEFLSQLPAVMKGQRDVYAQLTASPDGQSGLSIFNDIMSIILR